MGMKGGDEGNRVGALGWGGERSCFASEKKKKRVFGGEGRGGDDTSTSWG